MSATVAPLLTAGLWMKYQKLLKSSAREVVHYKRDEDGNVECDYLMKPSEYREPTITYSGMIPGEMPSYRPLLSEQIDIEHGLKELGEVSAGLDNVEDALEEWGEYFWKRKLRRTLCYLDQCMVDWDDEDSKIPSAYLREGDNYSRGYSSHLIGWPGETGECDRFDRLVRLLREGTRASPAGYSLWCG